MRKRFPDGLVEAGKDSSYLRRVDAASRGTTAGTTAATLFELAGGLHTLDVERARFRDLLVELIRLARLEYSLFLRTDVMLENPQFQGKTLEQMRRLVMEQASADTSLAGLSGQEIGFQDAETSRCREIEIDPDTGSSGPPAPRARSARASSSA